jgi:hypothetical protein
MWEFFLTGLSQYAAGHWLGSIFGRKTGIFAGRLAAKSAFCGRFADLNLLTSTCWSARKTDRATIKATHFCGKRLP